MHRSTSSGVMESYCRRGGYQRSMHGSDGDNLNGLLERDGRRNRGTFASHSRAPSSPPARPRIWIGDNCLDRRRGREANGSSAGPDASYLDRWLRDTVGGLEPSSCSPPESNPRTTLAPSSRDGMGIWHPHGIPTIAHRPGEQEGQYHDDLDELVNRVRKYKRAPSTIYLPQITRREPDDPDVSRHKHGSSSLRRHLQQVSTTDRRDGGDQDSSVADAAERQARKLEPCYEKRPRHRTRKDKYELKTGKAKTAYIRGTKNKNLKLDKQNRSSKPSVDTGLMKKFKGDAFHPGETKLKNTAQRGLLVHGKSSKLAPVPDLAFTSVTILPTKPQKESILAAAIQRKRKLEADEDEITKLNEYFRKENPSRNRNFPVHVSEVSTNSTPILDQQPRKRDRRQSKIVPPPSTHRRCLSATSDKSTCKANVVVESLPSSPSKATTYFSWSPSVDSQHPRVPLRPGTPENQLNRTDRGTSGGNLLQARDSSSPSSSIDQHDLAKTDILSEFGSLRHRDDLFKEIENESERSCGSTSLEDAPSPVGNNEKGITSANEDGKENVPAAKHSVDIEASHEQPQGGKKNPTESQQTGLHASPTIERVGYCTRSTRCDNMYSTAHQDVSEESSQAEFPQECPVVTSSIPSYVPVQDTSTAEDVDPCGTLDFTVRGASRAADTSKNLASSLATFTNRRPSHLLLGRDIRPINLSSTWLQPCSSQATPLTVNDSFPECDSRTTIASVRSSFMAGSCHPRPFSNLEPLHSSQHEASAHADMAEFIRQIEQEVLGRDIHGNADDDDTHRVYSHGTLPTATAFPDLNAPVPPVDDLSLPQPVIQSMPLNVSADINSLAVGHSQSKFPSQRYVDIMDDWRRPRYIGMNATNVAPNGTVGCSVRTTTTANHGYKYGATLATGETKRDDAGLVLGPDMAGFWRSNKFAWF